MKIICTKLGIVLNAKMHVSSKALDEHARIAAQARKYVWKTI